MSIKSLLQIILFLLIILIIGGLYFTYFYTKPLDKELKSLLNGELDNNILTEDINTNDPEILEENNLTQKKIEQTRKQNDVNMVSSEKLSNLTKEIEYVTEGKNWDIFKILAKFGKTNIKDSNILDLEDVNGSIVSDQRPEIVITSDYAEYNYSNQNSKFYSNVKINYDNKLITCDNLKLDISDNLAIAYDNVLIIDGNSKIKANNVTMNIITKDIRINSENNVKILKNWWHW